MNIIERLKEMMAVSDGQQEQSSHSLELATAVLLFEVICADHVVEAAELDTLHHTLRSTLHLSQTEIDEVTADARERHAQNVGVFEYTRMINELADAEQKGMLVAHLWEVAFADGHASAIEEHTIRRISDLLYVPHREFIRAKQIARRRQTG